MAKDEQEKPGLMVKLLAVMEHLHHIEKRGRNDHHNYDYVRAEDVVMEFRRAMVDQGLVFFAECVGAVRESLGGKQDLTRAQMRYTIADPETGTARSFEWFGEGADAQDKGIYKAYTGGLKYWIIETFLVNTGEEMDPEYESGPPVPKADRPTDNQIERAKELGKKLVEHDHPQAQMDDWRHRLTESPTKKAYGAVVREMKEAVAEYEEDEGN